MGIRYSKPPVLMHDVIGDLGAVVRLLERQAPYTPPWWVVQPRRGPARADQADVVPERLGTRHLPG